MPSPTTPRKKKKEEEEEEAIHPFLMTTPTHPYTHHHSTSMSESGHISIDAPIAFEDNTADIKLFGKW